MIISKSTNNIVDNLKEGKIVCFKTDTIWGISANPLNGKSINSLYTLKQRNVDKPFIFLISKNQDITKLVDNISPLEQKLIDAFWPGPLTIIFKAKSNLQLLDFYSNKDTIALRMPNDNLTQEILSKLDFPIPSTSVNLQNQPALNSFEEIYKNFQDKEIYILNKNNSQNNNISSTIVAVENNKIIILREGEIEKEKILSKCT